MATEALVHALEDVATRLRVDSIRATTAAGSGHPTSAASAADLVAGLFFAAMRFDPDEPRGLASDRFVLSKGHAAPLLYAAWAAVGRIPREALLTLRDRGRAGAGQGGGRLGSLAAIADKEHYVNFTGNERPGYDQPGMWASSGSSPHLGFHSGTRRPNFSHRPATSRAKAWRTSSLSRSLSRSSR